MKKFLKSNLLIIIVVAVFIILAGVFATIIYKKANQKAPDYVIQENCLVMYRGSSKEIEIPSEVESIGASVFESMSKIETVSFKDNKVKDISYNTFKNCVKLSTIDLPSSLETISDSAFYGCSQLKSIVIPEGVTSIGDNVFINCTELETITLPSTLQSLGEDVFYGCSKLTTINISTSNNDFVFENGVLYNKAKTNLLLYITSNTATSYTVPSNVTTIAPHAFYNNSNLTNVVINENVKQIGKGVLSKCVNIAELTIPFVGKNENEPTKITNFFDDNLPETLKSITILGGKSISMIAFRNCVYLENVILPNTLQTIESDAFFSCEGLKEITIPASVTYIGTRAFDGCKNLTIKIDKTEAETTDWLEWNPDNCDVIYLK